MMAAAFFAGVRANAQIRKIPAVVTDALKDKYPAARGVEWKDKLTAFQADFKLNGDSYQARFNSTGEWLETEKNISEDKLPTFVKDGFEKSKYTEWEKKEFSYLEKKEGDELYRILVKKSDLEKKYLFFDKKGKLIRDSMTL